MSLKAIVLAIAAAATFAAPLAASAEPDWGRGGDGGRYAGDRQTHERYESGRDGERRDDGRAYGYRGGYDGGYVRGYYPRCYWAPRGVYNAWGQYQYRQVQVCH